MNSPHATACNIGANIPLRLHVSELMNSLPLTAQSLSRFPKACPFVFDVGRDSLLPVKPASRLSEARKASFIQAQEVPGCEHDTQTGASIGACHFSVCCNFDAFLNLGRVWTPLACAEHKLILPPS